MKFKNTIIVDLDMIVDFRTIDPEIISSVFGTNSLIKKLDNFLQKINNLDYITNNKNLFNLRIYLYSILSNRSLKRILEIYSRMYIFLGKKKIKSRINLLKKLEKNEYEIIILTHNLYGRKLNCIYPVKFVFNKKKYIKKYLEHKNILYIIGDNYTDDIKTAKAFGIKSIYVGKSKFVALKSDFSFSSVEDAFNFIIAKE